MKVHLYFANDPQWRKDRFAIVGVNEPEFRTVELETENLSTCLRQRFTEFFGVPTDGATYKCIGRTGKGIWFPKMGVTQHPMIHPVHLLMMYLDYRERMPEPTTSPRPKTVMEQVDGMFERVYKGFDKFFERMG